jgi:RHS repeat-associated protein
VSWPGFKTTAWHQGAPPQDQNTVYMGTLLEGQRDASGQMYMRNLFYDPATGQFTQKDPIGLGGGLNAYGFAAGDPVSYSDPYGLCPRRYRIEGNLCSGGLTPGQWDRVEEATQSPNRRTNAQSITSWETSVHMTNPQPPIKMHSRRSGTCPHRNLKSSGSIHNFREM